MTDDPEELQLWIDDLERQMKPLRELRMKVREYLWELDNLTSNPRFQRQLLQDLRETMRIIDLEVD